MNADKTKLDSDMEKLVNALRGVLAQAGIRVTETSAGIYWERVEERKTE